MRIAYVFPKTLYDTKMSPGRVLYGHYMARRSELTWTGIGWDNYDARKSLGWNLSHLGGFDAVWIYKPEGLIEVGECGVTRFMIFNEAYDVESTLQEIRDASPGHVFFHHIGDLQLWRTTLEESGISSTHISHASPVVPSRTTPERDVRAILTGVQSPEIYPVRHRMWHAMKGVTGGLIRQHPGYRLQSHSAVVDQYRQYLFALKSAQMSMCCTSIYRYPLAKLFESIGCGAVPVTDKPDCPMFESFLWPYCVQVDPGMSSGEISDLVNSQDVDSLRIKQQNLTMALEERFTLRHWADHVLHHVSESIKRMTHA